MIAVREFDYDEFDGSAEAAKARKARRVSEYRAEADRMLRVATRTDHQGVIQCKARMTAALEEAKRAGEGKPPKFIWSGDNALGVWLPKVYRP